MISGRKSPPPPLAEFDQYWKAPDDDVRRFVAWACEWHGIDRPDLDRFCAVTREALNGAALKPEKVGTDAHRVALAAFKAIAMHCRRRAELRTRVHPFTALHAYLPRCCDVARRRNGEIYPIEHAPLLPLDGCTADNCLCMLMGIRRTRALEMGLLPPD